jgi:hypothetical protein
MMSPPGQETATSLRVWALACTFLFLLGVVLELVFRSGAVWQIPLPYLLRDDGDRYTRAVWLAHHPVPATDRQVMVLGASTAAAVTELPHDESESILRQSLPAPDLRLTSLTVPRSCYEEYLTLLQNALELGHRPDVVVVFSWPACLNDDRRTHVLFATRMPLTSSWLAEVTRDSQTRADRLEAAFIANVGVARYRYTVNAWVRSRWEGVLRGRLPWSPIYFAPSRRSRAWDGPWEADVERYQQLQHTPKDMELNGRSRAVLGKLLSQVHAQGAKAVVVEAPWSPPFFEVLRDKARSYHEAMEAVTSRNGAVYVDPNAADRLDGRLFDDLYHVNHDGARVYLRRIAEALRPVAPPR